LRAAGDLTTLLFGIKQEVPWRMIVDY
jgi:hypothetical protein